MLIECNENESIVFDGVTYYKPIQKEKKLTGWEEPENGCPYLAFKYDRNSGYAKFTEFDERMAFDINMLANTSAFKIENELFVKDLVRHELLWRSIAKWQALNDFACGDGNGYSIGYFDEEKISVWEHHKYFAHPNTVLFSSKEKCLECIEVFKRELLWDMNEFKWRLDGE